MSTVSGASNLGFNNNNPYNNNNNNTTNNPYNTQNYMNKLSGFTSELQNQFSDKTSGISSNQSGIIQTLASLYFQILSKIAHYGIDKTASFFNLDPNANATDTLKDITSNLTRYKELLKSPEGKQLMGELSIILSVAIKQLDKPINELTRLVNELIDKEISVGQQFLFNEIKIALGPIGATIEIINDVLTATSNAAETASEATGIFKDEVDKFNQIKDKIALWLEKLKTASNSYDQYQKSSGISSLKNGFNSVQDVYNLNKSTDEMKQNMNAYTSNLGSRMSGLRSNLNSTVAPNNSMAMRGGKKALNSLKHIQRGGKMAAKRTKKSINEFLNSGIKSSQIVKKLKSKTKRKVR
jgi:hypothetical protein